MSECTHSVCFHADIAIAFFLLMMTIQVYPVLSRWPGFPGNYLMLTDFLIFDDDPLDDDPIDDDLLDDDPLDDDVLDEDPLDDDLLDENLLDDDPLDDDPLDDDTLDDDPLDDDVLDDDPLDDDILDPCRRVRRLLSNDLTFAFKFVQTNQACRR